MKNNANFSDKKTISTLKNTIFIPNITISPMTQEDLLFLEKNLITEFDDFWNYSILKQEFYNENTTYIVAKQDKQIIGFAGFLTIIDEANIMNIVTKKDKRNLKVGSLLLENLIKICKQKKLKSITLEVNEDNIPAIKLYEKFNFNKVGIRKKYYNNTESAIIMTLVF